MEDDKMIRWFKTKDNFPIDLKQIFDSFILNNSLFKYELLHYDEECFGNILVTVSRDNVLLRYVRDRDFWRVDLGYKEINNEWVDFGDTLKYVYGETLKYNDSISSYIEKSIMFESKYHKELLRFSDLRLFKGLDSTITRLNKRNSKFL